MRRKLISDCVNDLLKNHSIRKPPVRVDRIAKKIGIKIQQKAFENELSGVLIRKNDQAVIGINRDHHENRQRFTVAHELGHFFLHEGNKVFIDQNYKINQRNSVSSTGDDGEEVEANFFASLLLMPSKFITKDLKKLESMDLENDENALPTFIKELAEEYGVSTQAMAIRIANQLRNVLA